MIADIVDGELNIPFERLFVFGAGGFGREVAWLAEQIYGPRYAIEFVIDGDQSERPISRLPVRILDELVVEPSDRFVVAVGNPSARQKIVERCRQKGLAETILVHPRSEVSQFVSFGQGSIICAGVIATVDIDFGEHVHVNIDCTIGHDVKCGAFTTLSPGVHVSGNVTIGSRVFIGTGATIINGSPGKPLMIGDDAIIAAGACVTGPVSEGALVAGVPGIRKR